MVTNCESNPKRSLLGPWGINKTFISEILTCNRSGARLLEIPDFIV